MTGREHARRFHFLREIASGGFGTVYLCKVQNPDGFSRVAAVKLLKQQWSDSDEVVRRIRDEARLLGLLRHKAIVTVYDLTSIDGRAAVVMEYIEGVDLRTVVKAAGAMARRGVDQGVPVRAALDLGAVVASALDAAYNRPPMPGDKPLRVIHRDIKPSNIMVDAQGDVKVLDFGVARSDIDDRESHTEELQFGSVDYMAPERLFFEPETPSSDVYALGATLYEVLALEKLGKARGREEQHAAQVEDRLSFLRARLRVRGTVATELMDLLRASVAFRHESRPTAAELHQRCRALARLVEDEDLASWSEREIPPLVAAAARTPRQAGALTDAVRTEDSISRGVTGSFRDGAAASGLGANGLGASGLGATLQKGALAELEDSAEVAAAGGAAGGAAGAAWDDEWDDIPTHVGALSDPTDPPEPLSQDIRPVPVQVEEDEVETLREPEPMVQDPADPELFAAATPDRVAPQAFGGGPQAIGGGPQAFGGGPQAFGGGPQAFGGGPQAFGGGPQAFGGGPQAFARPADGAVGPHHTIVPDDPGAYGGHGADLDERYAHEATALDAHDASIDETTSGLAGHDAGPRRLDSPFPEDESRTQVDVHAAPPPPPARSSRRPVIVGALAGGCLLFVVAGGLLAAGAALISQGAFDMPRRGPVVSEEHAGLAEAAGALDEVAEEPEEAPAAAAPDGLVFESLAPDTKKLNVQCTGGSAKGGTSATVDVASADQCTVTAIMQDRSRLVAVVDGVEAGAYGCFDGGDSRCERR
ncbi:MAG: serine/threonine protein kinase [Alphaproteobacteria bacterium]|nr:serine/threonine protein kinase [Alphaproteobacteria bacterium]